MNTRKLPNLPTGALLLSAEAPASSRVVPARFDLTDIYWSTHHSAIDMLGLLWIGFCIDAGDTDRVPQMHSCLPLCRMLIWDA